jgi:solute carrier family 12 sodium/potassium/chloride transporter 2
VGLTDREGMAKLNEELEYLAGGFRDEGVFTQSNTVTSEGFYQGTINNMQVLSGAFFSPNVVFMKLSKLRDREETFENLVTEAKEYSIGIQIFEPDPIAQLGRRSQINVWFKDIGPNWHPDNLPDDTHLSLLSGYKLRRNWNAKLRVLCGVSDAGEVKEAERFLGNLLDQARLTDVELSVINEDFDTLLSEAPQADLDIFGLGKNSTIQFMHETADRTESACLFVKDSGRENILA